MFIPVKYREWHPKIMIASVLFLFALIHFFYDPYTAVKSIAESIDVYELEPGDPEVRLVSLSNVKPGEHYKVKAQVSWGSVEDGSPSYKHPRVVFVNYNKQGSWIPSAFSVCGVTGEGSDCFDAVFTVPDGAVSARLVLQHWDKTGWIRLSRFSLQQMAVKESAPMVFRGLQSAWFLTAGWAIWRLRLIRRGCGVAVVLVAGLIAVGVLLPGKVVRESPDLIAGLVHPADVPVDMASSAAKEGEGRAPDAITKDGDRVNAVVQSGRTWLARAITRLDFNLLGHVGLFFLLGGLCGVYFRTAFKDWPGLFRVFAGGALYAVAAELLQVTELTRSVQCSDVGVNVLGWLIGLLAVAFVLWSHRSLSKMA